MSELKLLKEIEKINKRVEELERVNKILPDWITLKNLSNHLTVSRQAVYKRIVESGRYKPGLDFKKDGKDIYVSLSIFRRFVEAENASA